MEEKTTFRNSFTDSFYKNIIETVNDGLWVTNKDDVLIFMNAGMEKIAGVARDQCLGLHLLQDFPDETIGEFKKYYLQAKATLEPVFYQAKVKTPAGKMMVQQGILTPQINDGLYAGMICTIHDITKEMKKDQMLQHQNRFLQNILNTSPNCIYVKDKEGRYIIANDAIAKLYQTTPDEMIGRKDADFSDQAVLKPNEAEYFVDIDSKVIETKEPQTIPCESFTWDDGAIHYFHTTKIPITYKDNPDCVMGISVDITDVKASEKKIMENEEKFRSIFERSILGIIIFQDGKIVLTNHAINELMGYTQEYYDSLSAVETLDLIHPDDRKMVAQRFQERMEGKDVPDSYNIRVLTKSNKQIVLNINPQIIDFQGKPAIEVITKDVTDQIKSEQELQITKQRLEDAERTARIGNVEWYVKEGKGYWSDVMFDLYERDRSLGVPSYDEIMALHHPDDAKRLEEAVNKAITEGIPYGVDLRTNLPSEKEMVFHAIGVPIRDEQGVVSSIKGTVQDVTKRVEIEHRSQLSEENYKSIFNNTVDTIFVHDYKTGKIIDVNPATIKTFGYSKEEISEMDVGDLSINEPPYTQNEAVEWIQKAAADGPQRFEWLAKNKKDELIWFDNYLQLVEIAGEKRILVIGRNINEEKKAREALKYAHDRYQRLTDNVPGVIYQYKEYPDERKDEFTYISPSVREMYGLDPFKVQENSDLMWDAILPEDADGFSQSIADAEKTMSMWHTQWRIRTTKGMLKWLDGIARPERLPDGSLLWDGLLTDISERKHVEEQLRKTHHELKMLNQDLEKKVEERTEQVNQLLDQKDEFINQLGHDLKNPLGPLVNLLPILEKNERDQKNKEILKVINRNVFYMKNLVTRTIQLAQLRSPSCNLHYENVMIKDDIDEILEINMMLFKEHNIEVKNNIRDDLLLSVDRIRVHEVFHNVLNNAVKYSKDEGGMVTIDQNQVNDGFVTISVSDDGIGMTEEQLDKVFDEFFKADCSRHDFDSSGLGMPITKRIVEMHGGKIWVESDGHGKGSTFYFTLPLNN